MSQPLLQVDSIAKKFGSLSVLVDIDLTLQPGEVVGIAGRNGAGVSTLFRILGGLLDADSGSISYRDKRYQGSIPAGEHDISIIHQYAALADQLDVTTNIFLGQELPFRYLDRFIHIPNQSRMVQEASRLLTKLDAPFIPLHEKVSNLSAEQKQLTAIAHVMALPGSLILIDKPQQDLSIPYQRKMLQLISEWQAAGRAILFGSDNLDHLFAVADRILVLRQGRIVRNVRTDQTTREDVVESLVGERGEQWTPAIWALDSFYQAREQAEMLKHNQKLLERDLRARDSLNRQLVEQLGRQVEALDAANLALQAAQRRLMTEREQERKHLAREIHDQAIQDLLSINYELEDVTEHIEKETIGVDDVESIRRSIRQLIEELRSICGDLRPPTIDSLGLGAALRSYTQEWTRRTNIPVTLEVDEDFGRLPEALELSIFRIVQEGLNNIWKHAKATEASVSLKPTTPRLLLISIADNGQGMGKKFDIAKLGTDGHYGLLGISERVALLGGQAPV